MTGIITDLSSSPYWDDYNEDKQFYRVLFVPKRAVQVREMNQLQNMIQTQIQRFGNHVFKDGSIVYGCNITYQPNQPFVRLGVWNDFEQNIDYTTAALQNFLAVSPVTGLRATIKLTVPGFIGNYPDTTVFYIDYINKGRDSGDNEVTRFSAGETIEIYNEQQDKFGALNPGFLYNSIDLIPGTGGQHATGTGYLITVGDGVIYQKGYFVQVQSHTIIVSMYDQNTSGKLVGFETRESIVSYLQDNSLIDPADTSNRNGIGADRLKLSPVLVTKDRAEVDVSDDFFPIIEFGSESAPIRQNSDPEYAKLGDQLAKEKYEESGDYYVKPFIVSTRQSANSENFQYTVDAGISYVKGNRVQLLDTITLEQPRATDLGYYNNNITTINYGNYILINEVTGTFNADKLVPVDIYDAVQTSITSSRPANSPVGNKIGVANVRAVLYDRGVKGTAAGTYRFYLTNISMDSGKSFTVDAKSLVVSAGTNQLSLGAIADIILTDSRAVVYDSSSSGLVFPSGVTGTSRLRDSLGVNDTTFTFRDTSTATLQANGSVTFTLNTPYAGGSERFFVSPGNLTTANKLRIDITTTSALQSANLAGTVDGNSGNTDIIGLGTSFLTDFVDGEIIRIDSTNYQIATVVSDTLMISESVVTGGTSTDNYSKFVPAGGYLDLTNPNVTAVSNTQFVVDLGYSVASGAPQSLVATYPVIRGEAYEIKKEVNRGTYVKIDCTSNTSGPYNLGIVDIFSIDGVWVGDDYSENNPNRIGWFSIDNGQQRTHYDHAKLILKPEYQGKLDSTTRILVKLNHFTSNTTAGIGFYSTDSYPVRAPGDSANTTNISFNDIPQIGGISLRDAIDFRPQRYNTATITTDANTASVNPTAANTSFNINLTAGSYLSEPDSNFQADIQYYLPRWDLIQVNKNGIFSVKSSVPAEKPIVPFADNDSMAIATSYVAPYPGVTADEALIYKQSESRIRTNMNGIRGYTMKDINALDKRITTLEYYQSLSMLEQQAKDYNVKDEMGLDRFKNGIFADPLKNHLLGDVSNFEYSIAIDELNEIARPKFNKNSIDLDVNSSSNVKSTGRIATIDYTREIFIDQPYATKFRNLTESMWKWNGHLQLFPEYDHSKNETLTPEVNVEVDLSTPWEQFTNSSFQSNFGEWRMLSSIATQGDRRVYGPNHIRTGTYTLTASSTTVGQIGSGNQGSISTSQARSDLGSYVTDVTLNPFMRAREVAFVATGLTPNAKMWVFFADEDVTEFTAPGILNTSIYNQNTGEITIESGKESDVVIRTGNFGDDLITDSTGNLYGVFNIPEGRFRVGDRRLMIVDVDDIVLGADAILSSASAIYSASSLTINTRDVSISTSVPQPAFNNNLTVNQNSLADVKRRIKMRDPLAQSFLVDLEEGTPGVFLDAIEVFFRSKDENMGVTCYITEMLAGVPDTSKVLASAYLKPTAVNISNDSSVSTIFKFNDVPYLERGKYYAFFLAPDGDSPEYTAWVSEVGDVDILTGIKIFSNPYVGVMFKSANSNTWDAISLEDIKFKAHICNFNIGSSSELVFSEQDDEYLTVDGFAIANTATSIKVGDFVYTSDANDAPIMGNNAPFAVVQSFSQLDDTITLDSSTGGFSANTKIQIYRPTDTTDPTAINANTLVATSTIMSVDDIEYSIIVPRVAITTPAETRVSLYYKGEDQAGITDANWFSMMEETELELIDKVRVIKSKSNRNDPEDKSSELRLVLESRNRYLSPIVNLRRRSMYAIDNIINNDITNESTRYGNARTKLVGRMITLAEGQDAEDIKVFVTAYRPTDTDIHVYMKLLSGDDPDAFYDKLWTKLDMVEGAGIFSSTIDTDDFREFGFSLPLVEEMQGTAYRNSNGVAEYRNQDGTIFIGYKSFAIKIVLTSNQKQRVPRIDDYRGICLT